VSLTRTGPDNRENLGVRFGFEVAFVPGPGEVADEQ
jgi:hypothetical protein